MGRGRGEVMAAGWFNNTDIGTDLRVSTGWFTTNRPDAWDDPPAPVQDDDMVRNPYGHPPGRKTKQVVPRQKRFAHRRRIAALAKHHKKVMTNIELQKKNRKQQESIP